MSTQYEGLHEDVEWLVGAALKKLPAPYGENVIEDVFLMIEQSPNLLKNYHQLLGLSDQATVNQAIGRLTRVLTGYKTSKQVIATRTTLAQSFSILLPKK